MQDYFQFNNKRCRRSYLCPPPPIRLRETGSLNPYPETPSEWHLIPLKKQSKVQEILAVNDSLLISLQHSGICCVFKRPLHSMNLVQFGYLNHRPDEIVRSLFHNQVAGAVVIVSVYPEDKRAVLKCRSIQISDIEEGNFHLSEPILTEEKLDYPGWIELCEVNSRILTFAAGTKTYKVWDLKGYKFLFQVQAPLNETIVDIKASPGVLLLSSTENGKEFDEVKVQKIRLLDIADGSELYSFNHTLTTHIELVEQFCDKVLIKEHSQDLLIVSMLRPNDAPVHVKISPHRLSAFTFLHHSRMFLTFQNAGRVVSFSNSGQELVVIHEEEEEDILGGGVAVSNPIVLVARDQETLLSVRKIPSILPEKIRAVEFKSCSNGKLLGRVEFDVGSNEITCIAYDEQRICLYVGMRDGTIRVFS